MPKFARKRLNALQIEAQRRWEQMRREREKAAKTLSHPPQSPQNGEQPLNNAGGHALSGTSPGDDFNDGGELEDQEPPSERLLMDPAHMLQFSLPTTVDMRLSYGAGYGGINKERERKYIPTVPPEFLAKLDISGNGSGSFVDEKEWNRGSEDS